jgi:hypothetical protein
MLKIVHRLEVDCDNTPVTQQIEQVCVEESRASSVRSTFQEHGRTYLVDGLLNHPQVEHVLPNRLAEPGDVAEVVGLADESPDEL